MTEFLLPKDNTELRVAVMGRSLTKEAMKGFLNYEVEYSITRIFESKIFIKII